MNASVAVGNTKKLFEILKTGGGETHPWRHERLSFLMQNPFGRRQKAAMEFIVAENT